VEKTGWYLRVGKEAMEEGKQLGSDIISIFAYEINLSID